MPLLQPDNRADGRSTEDRHSLTDIFGLDTITLGEPPAAPNINHRSNGSGSEVSWWEPSSPEVAQTPRALVPSACFPPQYSRTFASYSENSQPECETISRRGIVDLVASFRALTMPMAASEPQSARSSSTCNSVGRSEEYLYNAPERAERAQRGENVNARERPRRASVYGAMPSREEGRVLQWCGELPARCMDPSAGFSPKVFLGGLPWDVTEHVLTQTLNRFRPLYVEWPGREGGTGGPAGSPRGYAYVTLESERQVRALLAASRRDGYDWYYWISSKKMRCKEVQVIPWSVSDSNWVMGSSVRLEPTRTVFVGALHGMLTAAALATIMNDLFSGVVYAGIDTDKNKYPIGSGRVTFDNVHSYIRAVSAAYVEIRTRKFTKKVQVDPYLEDAMCSGCSLQQGPYFCREPVCFRYFCRSCWARQHVGEQHKPLMRSPRATQHIAAPAPAPALAPAPAPALALAPAPARYSPLDSQVIHNGVSGLAPAPVPARYSPPTDPPHIYNGVSEGTPSPSTSATSEFEVNYDETSWAHAQ